MNLLQLPTVMLEHIFSFLTYDQVAKNRIVCKDFDIICQSLLNRGFQMMEKRLSAKVRAIKTQLPRRESERRCHPLSRNCDILISIETRFSMLSMAYSRFIEQGMCCFIPGKVLDEFERVICVVNKFCQQKHTRSCPLPLNFEMLQELRDVSGMATEYFEDVIAPSLKQRMQEYPVPISTLVNRYDMDIKKNPKTPSVPALEMALLREACLKNNRNILKMEKKYAKISRKLELYKRLMTLNKRQMVQKQIEHNQKIAELKQKIEEYEIKFNELTLSQNAGYKTCIKETDTRNRIFNMITKTNKMLNVRMRLRNFGNQIKLDPSPLRIGMNKSGRGSPIIKPRRAGLNLPFKTTEESLLIDAPRKPGLLQTISSPQITNPALSSDKHATSPSDIQNVLRKLNTILNESQDLIKKNKKASATSTSLVCAKENPWLKRFAASHNDQPLPSTSKSVSSEDSDLQTVEFPEDGSLNDVLCKGKKRTYAEICDQHEIPRLVNDLEKGYQTKIQPLILRLISSLSDISDLKRKRAQNNQE